MKHDWRGACIQKGYMFVPKISVGGQNITINQSSDLSLIDLACQGDILVGELNHSLCS